MSEYIGAFIGAALASAIFRPSSVLPLPRSRPATTPVVKDPMRTYQVVGQKYTDDMQSIVRTVRALTANEAITILKDELETAGYSNIYAYPA